MSKDESRFYPLACSAVQELFQLQAYTTDFAILGGRGRHSVPERFLKTTALRQYANQLPTPDIIGLVSRGGREHKLVWSSSS
jgi:hypothetical protein